MRRPAATLAWLAPWGLLGAILLAGCTGGGASMPSQASPSGSPSAWPGALPPLAIRNGTTLTVTLLVNGTLVGAFAPGSCAGCGGDDGIPSSQLPPLPWIVEARSPSGRVLASITVHQGEVSTNAGRAARVDLSCGRLDVWSGPPLAGGFPASGSPGDCAP